MIDRARLHRWTTLPGGTRWLAYAFGPGTASTMAAPLDDGTWLVVSPALGAPPRVLGELAEQGDVSVLVAPNAYHHLGQAEWRRRFPAATSYAPEGALARLRDRSPEIPYVPLSELARRLPARMSIVEPEGMKTPDVLLRATSGEQTAWWLGDMVSNNDSGDQTWFLRVLAPLVGSGPGYRRNTRPGLVYVRDQPAWLRSVRRAIEAHPPTVVVPAHGAPVVDDTARRTARLLAT